MKLTINNKKIEIGKDARAPSQILNKTAVFLQSFNRASETGALDTATHLLAPKLMKKGEKEAEWTNFHLAGIKFGVQRLLETNRLGLRRNRPAESNIKTEH